MLSTMSSRKSGNCATSTVCLPILRTCTLAAALLAGGPASASHPAGAPDDGSAHWSFRGFGSAGLVYADTSQADFTSSVLRDDGAGATRHLSASVDSRLGGQLDVNVSKQWSGVVQVVSEQRIDGSYRPLVEWANLKYQATPDLSLRVGRIALPLFMAADYRKIGYAYPAVRTPVEVYDAIPLSSSDGVDASYRWQAWGISHVTQVLYGRSRVKLEDDNRIKADKLLGLSHNMTRGALNARVTLMRADVTVNIANELFDAYRQFGPAGAAIGLKYELLNKRFDGFTAGATYDPGNWFVTAELGRTNSRSFIGKTSTQYAIGGWRFDSLTPYLSYARVRSLEPTYDPGLPLTGLPPRLAATVAVLNNGLRDLLLTIPVQSTISAGLRWDLRADASLKLQYDRVTPRDGSRGTLIAIQPGYRSGTTVNVASAVLDFVF
jgi:hypothetical protein